MGIFKAAGSSISGTLSDQWKEMYYSDSLDNNVLMIKETIRRGKNSQNKTQNNVITDGSLICVADGQNAIIVENGRIIELYTEPGEHVYHSDLSKGVFSESGGVAGAARDAWDRFTFGGDRPAYDQRVYYFNTKSILNKSFWVDNCPARMVDEKTGIAMDVSLTVSGVFSYRIVDSVTFYKNHAGNQAYEYFESEMNTYLKTMINTYLYSSLAEIIGEGTRPSYSLEHIPEIREAVKIGVNDKLVANSGVEIENIALDGFTICNEDMRTIARLQKNAVYTNPKMAAAGIVGAQSDAMRTAAANTGAAGFMAVNTAAALGNDASKKIRHRCTGCGEFTEDRFCRNCGTKNTEYS